HFGKAGQICAVVVGLHHGGLLLVASRARASVVALAGRASPRGRTSTSPLPPAIARSRLIFRRDPATAAHPERRGGCEDRALPGSLVDRRGRRARDDRIALRQAGPRAHL